VVQPYQAWPAPDLLDPLLVSAADLTQELVDIVDFEGPVLVKRAIRMRLEAADIPEEKATAKMSHGIDSAVADALLTDSLVILRDGGSDEGRLVLHWPESPAVVVRERGPRPIPEIPLGEISALIKATDGFARHAGVTGIQNELLRLYQVPNPQSADFEHINAAINMGSGR
jgi:hypothetical protein